MKHHKEADKHDKDTVIYLTDQDDDALVVSTQTSGLGMVNIWVHQDNDLCGCTLQRDQIVQLRDALTKLLDQ